jgi:hypothetical protein
METAMQIPDFQNGEEYLLGTGGRPFYLHPYLHAILLCTGLAYISFLIILWTMPGKSNFGEKGKKIQIVLSKVMLY